MIDKPSESEPTHAWQVAMTARWAALDDRVRSLEHYRDMWNGGDAVAPAPIGMDETVGEWVRFDSLQQLNDEVNKRLQAHASDAQLRAAVVNELFGYYEGFAASRVADRLIALVRQHDDARYRACEAKRDQRIVEEWAYTLYRGHSGPGLTEQQYLEGWGTTSGYNRDFYRAQAAGALVLALAKVEK